MNLFKLIFPFQLQLNILQLEEYKILRFLRWILLHIFTRSIDVKKQLVVTPKIKKVVAISFVVLLFIAIKFGILFGLLLATQPYILFVISILLLKPYEYFNKVRTIENTRRKILSLKNLKVVGITGSFGKTSTKEILYQILKAHYKVIKTPESYNTIFGIAKVVDYEVNNYYDIFICEMAAYTIGEIKNLSYMVPPQFGIITGITPQHLERFGSLGNIIKAKFELFDTINNSSKMTFNVDDENIKNELQKRNIEYKSIVSIKNIKLKKTGSSFDLIYKNKAYKVNTTLFGFSNIKNIENAASMALKLGLNVKSLVKSINTLKPIDSRLQVNTVGKTSIVNNTYSSNLKSFEETIKTAQAVSGKKVLITPGLVELGKDEDTIHFQLGNKLNGIFDQIVLVGKNRKTESIYNNILNKSTVKFINDNRQEYFEEIQRLKNKVEWIFLENDLTQNY